MSVRPGDTPRDARPNVTPHRHRSSTNDTITMRIQEISEDEIGYEGDIEVVRPDQYEEPDSDAGELHDTAISAGHDYSFWQAKLAEKLRNLDCNSDTNDSQDCLDGPSTRKRRSREPTDPLLGQRIPAPRSATLEVTEVHDGKEEAHRPKRARRKSRRIKSADMFVKRLQSIKTDVKEQPDSTSAAMASSEGSLTTPESAHTAGEDAMEVD